MDPSTTQVAGYTKLMTTFKLLYPELEAALREGLREIVSQVAQTAEQVAAYQGFAPPGTSGRGTGLLIGSIRSGVTIKKGYVKDTASNKGYPYPRRFEYQHGRERAFLHPAIDLNRGNIQASLTAVVDEVSKRFNAGDI